MAAIKITKSRPLSALIIEARKAINKRDAKSKFTTAPVLQALNIVAKYR